VIEGSPIIQKLAGSDIVHAFPRDRSVAQIGVGRPDMAEFARATESARTFADLEDVVRNELGKTELMLFMELDLGAILRKETVLDTPKADDALPRPGQTHNVSRRIASLSRPKVEGCFRAVRTLVRHFPVKYRTRPQSAWLLK
jgi:hypothetical protein